MIIQAPHKFHRCALRCLRILCICEEVRDRITKSDGEQWLNRVSVQNEEDEFIQSDVRKIFKGTCIYYEMVYDQETKGVILVVFGDNKAVKRFAIASMDQSLEVMSEYRTNAYVS